MPEQVDGFADNWAYLKAELHWLERLLMAAVAKQRKETKEIDRVAQSKADRATSHWWKGLITTEGRIAYDEYRQATPTRSSSSQLEAQIQLTQQRGLVLALPSLRDRLKLSGFEKNVVLMALAPEVNRRYGRLYRYLQNDATKTDLPTLDLALRLLCKTDQEWRTARNHLVGSSELVRLKLLSFLPTVENTILNSPLKLSTALVNYLLSEPPSLSALEELLQRSTAEAKTAPVKLNSVAVKPTPHYLQSSSIAVPWSDLILPATTLIALQELVQRLQGYQNALTLWGLAAATIEHPGSMVLLAGAAGTGKTLAAQSIATHLRQPLWRVDLAQSHPATFMELLTEIEAIAPVVLYIQSAELWLKRSASLSAADLQPLWQRRRTQTITLFSVTQAAAVTPHWQRQLTQLQFALPNQGDRLLLWQRAFPPQVQLSETVNWQALSETLPLNGSEIRAISQEAILYAAAAGATEVEFSHILHALEQYQIAQGRARIANHRFKPQALKKLADRS